MFTSNTSRCLTPASKKMTIRLSFMAACVLAGAILALTALPARATAFTWDGEIDNLWDTTSDGTTNWSPDGIPDTDTDDVIFSGVTPHNVISLNGNRLVDDVEFSGSTNYTLDWDLSSDTLYLDGDTIDTSGSATFTITTKIVLDRAGRWEIDADLWLTGVISSTRSVTHKGEGTLYLTGGDDITPSTLKTLRTSSSGTVVLDGARIDLTSTDFSNTMGALSAYGPITIRNGADVNMVAANSFGFVGIGNDARLTVTGIDSSLSGYRLDVAWYDSHSGSILVEDNASLRLNGDLIIGLVGDGELTVQTGATASADAVYLGVESTASGEALVTGSGSVLSSNKLYLGGLSESSLGGTGRLTVEDGGAVQVAGETKFWDPNSSSITIDGGTFETDRLTNHTGVAANVTITDPAGGTALTVGTGNGSSTWDGHINGLGTLNKVGTGTLTLTNINYLAGTTNIDGGSIILNHYRALWNSTVSINVNDGLDVTQTNARIGALAGAGDLNMGSKSLIVGLGVNNRTTTYSGTLSGAGPLTKDGTGGLTLTGANT